MNEKVIAARQNAERRILEMAKNDSELAALMPDPKVTEAAREPSLGYQQIIAMVLAGYTDRPALATRAFDVIEDTETGEKVRQVLPRYTSITYGELTSQIEAVANFWTSAARHRVQPGEMVAFIAFNGAEMTAVDLAAAYVNAIVVPLQANYATRDLDDMLSDTAPVALVASVENLELAVDHALKQKSVRSLLVIAADERVDVERRALAAARARLADAGDRVALATFAEAVDEGQRSSFAPLPPPAGGRDRMVMAMYTSGSTGTPKGAIIHEAICVNAWISPRSSAPMISFVFAPMNHSMGRYALYATLAQGGTAYFTQKSDLSTMLEDIRLARPTTLGLIPRICELAQQHHLAEVGKRVAAGQPREQADREARAEMSKSFLGDRITSATVGSAPTTAELRQFMSDVFDMPVSDGYGNTESGGGGIAIDGQIMRSSVTDYKLVDVPELGYYTSDKPHPRGELLVKTRLMIKGYYKRPEESAAIFDPEGFLKTGDIVELRGPDQIVWLDRRNSVIKLSQGEYVAIGPLETAFRGHGKLINQIYLYGSSRRSFLLAVVVPELANARVQLGHEPSDAELRALVLEDLREAAARAEIRNFEIPRNLLIEREPFSLGNGLLSAVGKPLRSNLKARYGDDLEALYLEMEQNLDVERDELRNNATGRSTLERVAGAIRLHLGLAELDPAAPTTFAQLGGDSLGAVDLALLFEEIFGISVPVSNILHPAASPARISAQIDALLGGSNAAARFDLIHPDPAMIRADELTLEALLGDDALEMARGASAPVTDVRTVLLTGANGFLGRFLCVEWMERLAASGGKVICLVRGGDTALARQRIYDAIGAADEQLAARFRALADAHLEVLPADLSAPRLGLGEACFDRLAHDVDQIVHVAALVNHKLSYRNLFEPNVLGTAELVRLALTGRLKRFDYISTVAVSHLSPGMATAPESVDVREAIPDIAIGHDRYALGYAASKWAGEIILREVNEIFGLPVKVYRADMILPHARHAGQINIPDAFTRLLVSVIATGIAPKSFYQLGPDGERQSAHYDGMPVDFVAAIISDIGARADDGYHSYNLVNFHWDDGVSLDTIVDWIRSARYDVVEIADHQQWFQRFEDRMRNLPDTVRQNSCLSIAARFSVPMPRELARTPSGDFAAAVGRSSSGQDVPHLSESYIHKCVRDMQLLKLIGEPEAA